ncbi:MAG: SapB/AmfS family lanthipeptide [Labedaea sp.]
MTLLDLQGMDAPAGVGEGTSSLSIVLCEPNDATG